MRKRYNDDHWYRIAAVICSIYGIAFAIWLFATDPRGLYKGLAIGNLVVILLMFASFGFQWIMYKFEITENGMRVVEGISSKFFAWDAVHGINALERGRSGKSYTIHIYCSDKFRPVPIILHRAEAAELLRELAKHVPQEKWKRQGLEILRSLPS